MEPSLRERKLRITKRLEFTLCNTRAILDDINVQLGKIVDDNRVLETVADTYDLWTRKNNNKDHC